MCVVGGGGGGGGGEDEVAGNWNWIQERGQSKNENDIQEPSQNSCTLLQSTFPSKRIISE